MRIVNLDDCKDVFRKREGAYHYTLKTAWIEVKDSENNKYHGKINVRRDYIFDKCEEVNEDE